MFLVPVLSCARRAPASNEAGRAQPAGEAAPTRAPGQTASAAPPLLPAMTPPPAASRNIASPAQAPQAIKAQPKSALTASLRAFGLGANAALMPEDFAIGPLQDRRAGASLAAFRTAQRFMDGYSDGRLDPGLLYPAERAILEITLAPAADPKTPERFRLGKLTVDGDSAWLRVRQVPRDADPGRQGLLSLRSSDGEWYVESLSIGRPGDQGAVNFEAGGRAALGPGD